MKAKVKVGIIGFGASGYWNARGVLVGNGKVVAICDIKKNEHVAEFGKNWCREKGEKPNFYTSIESFLNHPGLELVIVTTPDDLHLEATKKSLGAGKFVFVEKPIATKAEDITEFSILVKEYPGKLFFGEKYSHSNFMSLVLRQRQHLGCFLGGHTVYSLGNCDRIMGEGKWRTKQAYNPCAGGLSHNFMTTLLFAGAGVRRVFATGRVNTYRELNRFGGYDTMSGVLEFTTGTTMTWNVSLAQRGNDNPLGNQQSIAHTFWFENGSVLCGQDRKRDILVVNGRERSFDRPVSFSDVNTLYYPKMLGEIMNRIREGESELLRHSIDQGIQVAWVCLKAFESARKGGVWLEISK